MRTKNRIVAFGSALTLLALCVLHGGLSGFGDVLSIPSAFAQTRDVQLESWVTELMGKFTFMVQLVGMLFIRLAEYLLSPDLLMDNAVLGDNGMLKTLWKLSRDIMNAVFAILLVGVAFYTIVVGDTEKIKEHFKYFILGVILVNFSWFFPRVIIDVSHVLTATVLSIPNLVPTGECVNLSGQQCSIITHVEIFPQEDYNCRSLGQELNPEDNECKCLSFSDDEHLMCWWVAPFSDNTTRSVGGILNALAVNFGRIESLTQVAKVDVAAGPAGDLAKFQFDLRFFLNIGFSLLFGIAMVFPIVALCVGLMIRILILWATIAFMPFSFIGFIFNKGKLGTNVFGVDFDLWKEFLNAAFLPVKVAIPLAVGFTMLLVGINTPAPASVEEMKIGIQFINGIDSVWKLLWAALALAILWKGAFDALSKSSIIGGFTEKIRGAGQGFGRLALKAPLLTPVPMPGGESMSLGSLTKFTNPRALEGMMEGKFADDLRKGRKKIFGSSPDEQQINIGAQILKDNKNIMTGVTEKIRKYTNATGLKDRRDAAKELKETLKEDLKVSSVGDKESDIMRTIELINQKAGNPGGIDADIGKAKELAQSLNVSIISADKSTQQITMQGPGGSAQQLGIGTGGTHDIADPAKRLAILDSLGIRDDMRKTTQGFEVAAEAFQKIHDRPEMAPEVRLRAMSVATYIREQAANPSAGTTLEDVIRSAPTS